MRLAAHSLARRRVCRASALFLLATSVAHAVSVDPLAADRRVYAEGTSFCPGCGPNGEDEVFSNQEEHTSLELGLFDETASSVGSSASQTSTLSATRVSGTGWVSTGFTGDNFAESRLSFLFQVPTTRTYTLEGELTLSGFLDVLELTLTSSTSTLFERFGPTSAFSEDLQLAGGETYTLSAQASGFDSSGQGGDGNWSFQLVPEPAVGLLLGLGLLGLGTARRRASATHSADGRPDLSPVGPPARID